MHLFDDFEEQARPLLGGPRISRKLTWKPKGAPNQWGLEDDVLEFSFSGLKFLFFN